ncbi:MAG: adenylate/guanylate cyclase domain-containing protein [Syntrophaceae bacterium]|nr:adenylate/guanylate cyclase domain-containing protein [Syntrophaceae bacterium]
MKRVVLPTPVGVSFKLQTREDLPVGVKYFPVAILHYGLSLTAQVISLGMAVILISTAYSVAVPRLAPYGLSMGKDHRYARAAIALEQTVTKPVRAVFPIRIGGHDMTPWIVLVLSFVLTFWFNTLSYRYFYEGQYYRHRKRIDDLQRRLHISDQAMSASALGRQMDLLKTAKGKDRHQILRNIAETEKKLDEEGRDLAFLSIDVVGSTGMKQDEDKAVVQNDFTRYRQFVSGIFDEHGCLKSTWTPDGVMACFPTVDDAVRAARAVITDLDTFNREVRQLRREFAVRCGVNSGFVIYDENLPLEEISDPAIDIAGHMQKHAARNAISIPKPVVEPLPGNGGFTPSGQVIDGYEIYEWKKG